MNEALLKLIPQESEEEVDVVVDSDEFDEWEDVPLISPSMNVSEEISVSVAPPKRKKRARAHNTKLKFAVHKLQIPMLLLSIKSRLKWLNDEKLARRLRQNVPKLIRKKFKSFSVVALKGLVLWFRDHFKVSSNGFRQSYLGVYPEISPICDIEQVRQFARDRSANRDILALFFLEILRSLGLDARLVCNLPLVDWRAPSAKTKRDYFKPANIYDTDLLTPYFWCEVIHDEHVYAVDPVVMLDNYVCEASEYVPWYDPRDEPMNKFITTFYCVRFDHSAITDVSPRYIKNIQYRYFSPLNIRSLHVKSWLWFKRFVDVQQRPKVHLELPKTIQDVRSCDSFVVPSLLKAHQAIFGESIGTVKDEPLYWRNSVLLLKSRMHWLLLGRTVNEECEPIKVKKYKSTRQRRLGSSETSVSELFAFHQTHPSPRLPTTFSVDDLSNEYGNVEIFTEKQVPHGYVLVPIKYKSLLRNELFSSVDVVSGFDFKTNPGYATPVKKHILISQRDEERVWELVNQHRELLGLYKWDFFIKFLRIKARVDQYK